MYHGLYDIVVCCTWNIASIEVGDVQQVRTHQPTQTPTPGLLDLNFPTWCVLLITHVRTFCLTVARSLRWGWIRRFTAFLWTVTSRESYIGKPGRLRDGQWPTGLGNEMRGSGTQSKDQNLTFRFRSNCLTSERCPGDTLGGPGHETKSVFHFKFAAFHKCQAWILNSHSDRDLTYLPISNSGLSWYYDFDLEGSDHKWNMFDVFPCVIH